MKTLAIVVSLATVVVAQSPVVRLEGLPKSVPFAQRFGFDVVLEGRDVGLYVPPRAEAFLPLAVDSLREEVESGKRILRVDASAVTAGSVTLRGVTWRASTPEGPATATAPAATVDVVSSLAPDAPLEPELPDVRTPRPSSQSWWWVLLVVPIGALWVMRRSTEARRRLTSLRRHVADGATDPRDVLGVARAMIVSRGGVTLDSVPASEWETRIGARAPRTVVSTLVEFGRLREHADYAGGGSPESEKAAALALADALIAWVGSGSR